MSSTKEKYVATTIEACHTICLRRLLKDMGHTKKDPTPIFCDNSSTITLSKHNFFHRQRKHIDPCYHFIHELVNNGDITLLFCGSKEQLDDMFTKPLGTIAFEFQRHHLGIGSAENIVPVEIKRVC